MKIMNEKEAEDFLEKKGFKVNKRGFATNLEKAKKIAKEIGYPVVLKNNKLLHKSDKGGVKLNIQEDTIEAAFRELKSNEVLIHKQGVGKEFLLGIKKDPAFGHVILFGIGGIYTEMLKDVSIRVTPIDKKDAEKMIDEIKYKEYYDNRGLKVNRLLLIQNILKLNDLAVKNKNIQELDINPLMVDDKNAVVADARIILE